MARTDVVHWNDENVNHIAESVASITRFLLYPITDTYVIRVDADRRKYIEVNNLEIISNGGKLLMHASIIRIKLTIYIQNRDSVYQ